MHPFKVGALAQLVEQRTENPCVPGSIPGGTTFQNPNESSGFLIFSSIFQNLMLKTIFLNLKKSLNPFVFLPDLIHTHESGNRCWKYVH